MKKYIIASLILLSAAAGSSAQNNVQLVPASGPVCYPMQLSLNVNGNSFQPVSYLWSTGETAATIQITTSGTYTLTVTGFHGNSNNMTTITKSATYSVLPAPVVTALTDLWVCKNDTVRLSAVSGYDLISWNNGTTGELFERKMINPAVSTGPILDTMSVFYTASLGNLCTTTSEVVLLRAIRKPNGVGRAYQGKMNIKMNDSIPAGLVLEYLYPVTYEMTFTDLANTTNIIKYVTAPGSRKAPASMLNAGATYSVETVPIINGKRYCSGLPSTIGTVTASANRVALGFTEEEGVKTYRIYNVQGQLLLERQGEDFDHEWLNELAPQMLIIHREGLTTEISKIMVVRQN